MARLWTDKLVKVAGWSVNAADRVIYSLAPSTIRTYEGCVRKLEKYCIENVLEFPPKGSNVIANFMCQYADKSDKPGSGLKVMYSALKFFYNSLNFECSPLDENINRLITGLIKSGTTVPMSRSTAMPVKCFSALFLSWPENELLMEKLLRLKSITLLALSLMLRPSDIAPRSVFRDKMSGKVSNNIFSTDRLIFNDDGSAIVTIFGAKNDTDRAGFQIRLPKHDVSKLDPVRTLKDYISRTQKNRCKRTKPVFISLVKPFEVLSAQQISEILNLSIVLAGLDGKGFSAKLFRCTGATAAIEGGQNAEIVRKMGRWKTSHVFF